MNMFEKLDSVEFIVKVKDEFSKEGAGLPVRKGLFLPGNKLKSLFESRKTVGEYLIDEVLRGYFKGDKG